ncbi:MAG: aminotransferase class I/II-fold pyridoxal phosphate-dependent enzyme [Aureibaculum sp.]
MLQLNKNITQLKQSATLAINQKVKELRQKGETVYHFGFGQSPFKIHKSITEELKQHVDNNKYLPSAGLPELKVSVSSFLLNHQGLNFDSESIFIGPGSKELLYQIIYLLEGVFLIPQGSWVSYLPQIRSKNAEFRIIETEFSNNYKLKASELELSCNNVNIQKTLILNSPNNPTGAVYSRTELKELAQACKNHNIVVLSDEIYSQINFVTKYTPSIADYYSEKTIVFGGLSKVFSAGGYRLGFTAIPKTMNELYQPLQSFFSETFSAVSSPIQYAAIKAYQMDLDLQDYIRTCSNILKEVGRFVYDKLEKNDIKCTEPQGAFYMIVDFEKFRSKLKNLNICNAIDLCDHLLRDYKIALLPGQDFYFSESSLTCRLAFVDFDGEIVYHNYKLNGCIDSSFMTKYMPSITNGLDKIETFLSKI